MSDDLQIDPRLPPLVEITEPTRQQLRRIARKPVGCTKCRRPLTAEDACFADGRDAHRSCAERWNAEIFNGWEQLKAQDAEEGSRERALAMGLAVPTGSRLWTPSTSAIKPPSTPAAVAAVA